MRSLAPQHRRLITDSAIAPEIAAQRGYCTVEDAADLAALGFAPYQCRVPGLLVPLWDVCGRNGRYQFRPDAPRLRTGKPVKYETPAGQANIIDAPPSIRPHVGNPAIPLYITEGARKADAAASRGLCCLSLSGVWNWRGRNAHGGKTALPDWELVALNGRAVSVAFDSDVMTKPSVRSALDRLAAFLAFRGARVRFILLPPAADGSKTGLDDYFAAGGAL